MPRSGARGVVGGPTSGIAAGTVFPRRLHAAGGGRRNRLPEQGSGLRHSVQGGGRDAEHDCRRSAPSRCRDRFCHRAPYLGPEPAAPSARSLPRPRRRLVFGQPALGFLPARLFLAGTGALPPVPAAVPGEAHGGVRDRDSGVLRRTTRRRASCSRTSSAGLRNILREEERTGVPRSPKPPPLNRDSPLGCPVAGQYAAHVPERINAGRRCLTPAGADHELSALRSAGGHLERCPSAALVAGFACPPL